MALRNALGELALDRPTASGDAHLVSGTKIRWRREFNDPALPDWDVVTGTGMVVSVSNSNLVVTTGTTINSTTSFTSKQMFTAPFKTAFGFKISQKIVNQEFYMELVKCNPTTGVVDETVVAAWRVAGSDTTTTTVARAEVRNGGAARTQSGNATVPTQTTDAIYEIILESDEVSFHTKPINSTASRSASTVFNSIAPDPTATYKVRYRIVNAGTAPASTTTFTATYATAVDYTEFQTELTGGPGNAMASSALPVVAAGGTLGATQGSGASSTVWTAAGYGGILVADVASAAITATATTAAVTPGLLANIGTQSHSFSVVVTAVSGTTPTMDVSIEESPDNGTNWVKVYDFPRITATGTYVSPQLRSTWGTRFRYVQTIAGTTPSFTRAINRIMFSSAGEIVKQFFDRSIVPNTLNSATPAYNVDGANLLMLNVTMGAVTTTAPQFQLQGSEDGTNWYSLGAALTTTANNTSIVTVPSVIPKFARAIVSTAGVGATLGQVSIKAVNA